MSIIKCLAIGALTEVMMIIITNCSYILTEAILKIEKPWIIEGVVDVNIALVASLVIYVVTNG